MIIDLDNRISSTLSSVVQGRSNKGNFSGSLVSYDLILSAEHVGTNNFKFTFNTETISATRVYHNVNLDIALFQLDISVSNITPLNLSIPNQTTLNLGNKAVGFSADFRGQSLDQNESTNIVGNKLFTNLDAFRGASGGPILDFSNNIVGVISYESSSRNKNVATKITEDIIDTVNYYDSLEGPVNFQHNEVNEETLDIKRYLNTSTNTHLYTNETEVIRAVSNNPIFVEEEFNLQNNEDEHLYKLHNTNTGSDFYTRNVSEYVFIQENLDNFVNYFEDSFAIEENTLHRLYNSTTNYHFYTDNSVEAGYLEDVLGFINEGFV